MNFCYGLAMRHFCSTTTKPYSKNRAVLAHNALPEQPEGTEARNESFSLFFVPSLAGTMRHFLGDG